MENSVIIRSENVGNILHKVVTHNGVLHIGGIVADNPTLDMAGQTKQVLTKLDDILLKHGSDRDHLLSVLIFITDMRFKPEMNRVWKNWFKPHQLPCRATLGITAIEEGVLLELVATAATK
jgi:enamine deaminase RidA (YjgF/YER057c/UK114 family)